MRTRVLVTIAASVAVTAALSADTITADDHRSLNGTVERLDADSLTLRAEFTKETKVLTLPRARLTEIEFNDETFNGGAPPSVGVRPPTPAAAPARPASPQDTVLFVGGDRRQCDRVMFDGARLTCGAETFTRGDLFRIRLGRRP
jgi:hypothetical protein